MMRKPGTIFKCFVATDIAIALLVGYIYHMESARTEEKESTGQYVRSLELRIIQLEHRPTTTVVVDKDGTMRLETDDGRTDNDSRSDGAGGEKRGLGDDG